MPRPRREERKVCCVCGRRKSKTWTAVKGCNACNKACAAWLESESLGVCSFHKARV